MFIFQHYLSTIVVEFVLENGYTHRVPSMMTAIYISVAKSEKCEGYLRFAAVFVELKLTAK